MANSRTGTKHACAQDKVNPEMSMTGHGQCHAESARLNPSPVASGNSPRAAPGPAPWPSRKSKLNDINGKINLNSRRQPLLQLEVNQLQQSNCAVAAAHIHVHLSCSCCAALDLRAAGMYMHMCRGSHIETGSATPAAVPANRHAYAEQHCCWLALAIGRERIMHCATSPYTRRCERIMHCATCTV